MSEMLDDWEIRGLLLRAAARDAGSAEAFERLYKLAAPLLLGVAKRIVGRAELAEEVLHDAFAKIWHAAGTFDPLATQPVAWMVAIARNRAIDTKASHDVSRVDSYQEEDLDRLFDWSESVDEAADRRRAAHWLRDCLSRLQAVERQALVLAYQHGLARYRTPWYQRAGFWKGWAGAATAALLFTLGTIVLERQEPIGAPIAQLTGKEAAVTAYLSRDGRTLRLSAARPIVAGPKQSYELWVIPPGEKPISVAVLGNLDARFAVSAAQAARLRAGATLAVSTEPAGGSPTGQPTGPVILAGKITL